MRKILIPPSKQFFIFTVNELTRNEKPPEYITQAVYIRRTISFNQAISSADMLYN